MKPGGLLKDTAYESMSEPGGYISGWSIPSFLLVSRKRADTGNHEEEQKGVIMTPLLPGFKVWDCSWESYIGFRALYFRHSGTQLRRFSLNLDFKVMNLIVMHLLLCLYPSVHLYSLSWFTQITSGKTFFLQQALRGCKFVHHCMYEGPWETATYIRKCSNSELSLWTSSLISIMCLNLHICNIFFPLSVEETLITSQPFSSKLPLQ